jgi:hypothetical protein
MGCFATARAARVIFDLTRHFNLWHSALPAARERWKGPIFLTGPGTVAIVRPTFGWAEGGNSSVVECNLAKVEVAGSNPVSRSKQAVDLHLRASSSQRAIRAGEPKA